MAKNTTIKRNGKEYNYFRITRTVGHKYKEGRKVPIKKQFVGSSERDAERKYKEWLLKHEEETVLDSNKTFGSLAEFYTDNILSVNIKYSVGTRDQYTKAYERYVKDSNLKDLPMSVIKAEDIQKFYNDLNVSHSVIVMVHKFMRGFMLWQSRNNYGKYLLDSVIIPEKPVIKNQNGIITWTDEELEKILSSEPDYVLLPLVTTALYTGLRISELIGLKYEDVYDDTIHVNRQYYRGTWCPPKGNKTRMVPVHEKIRDIVSFANEGLIFKSASGTPLDPKNINRSLDRYYGRIGIPHKKFHAYRATFITNLCRKGVPIQIVSKLAGHENINVTAKYYAAVDIKTMKQAVNKL